MPLPLPYLDPTHIIDTLIRADFKPDALRVSRLGGSEALREFVLDYLKIGVDWSSITRDLIEDYNQDGPDPKLPPTGGDG